MQWVGYTVFIHWNHAFHIFFICPKMFVEKYVANGSIIFSLNFKSLVIGSSKMSFAVGTRNIWTVSLLNCLFWDDWQKGMTDYITLSSCIWTWFNTRDEYFSRLCDNVTNHDIWLRYHMMKFILIVHFFLPPRTNSMYMRRLVGGVIRVYATCPCDLWKL